MIPVNQSSFVDLDVESNEDNLSRFSVHKENIQVQK